MLLLVVAPDARTAAWCAEPIAMGHPGWELRPIVLGPDGVPLVTDAAEATTAPELAVLSVLTHGREDRGADVALAALAAAAHLDPERARLYADLTLRAVSDATRIALEALMKSGKYEFQSDFAKTYIALGEAKGKAEGQAAGKAEGRASALLDRLDVRGLALPDATRARILACADEGVPATWLRRAVNAAAVDELFD